VEDHFDGRILEQSTEAFRTADWQRIDDCGSLARRKLEQVDSIDEAVEACAFGIQRDETSLCDRCQEGLDGVGRVEIERRMHESNLTDRKVAPVGNRAR
jgi:hypothetical protein